MTADSKPAGTARISGHGLKLSKTRQAAQQADPFAGSELATADETEQQLHAAYKAPQHTGSFIQLAPPLALRGGLADPWPSWLSHKPCCLAHAHHMLSPCPCHRTRPALTTCRQHMQHTLHPQACIHLCWAEVNGVLPRGLKLSRSPMLSPYARFLRLTNPSDSSAADSALGELPWGGEGGGKGF